VRWGNDPHGPNIMQGYWKRPEETEESIIELEGKKWLRTGDLVRMDEEGYFTSSTGKET
jgi:long-subunit acyl-CoA synthetase (AMP-forming)